MKIFFFYLKINRHGLINYISVLDLKKIVLNIRFNTIGTI